MKSISCGLVAKVNCNAFQYRQILTFTILPHGNSQIFRFAALARHIFLPELFLGGLARRSGDAMNRFLGLLFEYAAGAPAA